MKITILVQKPDLERLFNLTQGFPVDGNITWYHANGYKNFNCVQVTIAYNDYIRLIDHNE